MKRYQDKSEWPSSTVEHDKQQRAFWGEQELSSEHVLSFFREGLGDDDEDEDDDDDDDDDDDVVVVAAVVVVAVGDDVAGDDDDDDDDEDEDEDEDDDDDDDGGDDDDDDGGDDDDDENDDDVGDDVVGDDDDDDDANYNSTFSPATYFSSLQKNKKSFLDHLIGFSSESSPGPPQRTHHFAGSGTGTNVQYNLLSGLGPGVVPKTGASLGWLVQGGLKKSPVFRNGNVKPTSNIPWKILIGS